MYHLALFALLAAAEVASPAKPGDCLLQLRGFKAESRAASGAGRNQTAVDLDPHQHCEDGPCVLCKGCHETADSLLAMCKSCEGQQECHDCAETALRVRQECDFGCDECHLCHHHALGPLDKCSDECGLCRGCDDKVADCASQATSSEVCQVAQKCHDQVWDQFCSDASTEEQWAVCDDAHQQCRSTGWRCEQSFRVCETHRFECKDDCLRCTHCEMDDSQTCANSHICSDASRCSEEAWENSTQCWSQASTFDKAVECDRVFERCQPLAVGCENCFVESNGRSAALQGGGSDPRPPVDSQHGADGHRMRRVLAWQFRRGGGVWAKRAGVPQLSQLVRAKPVLLWAVTPVATWFGKHGW